MGRLIHNQTVQISSEEVQGLYRVIVNEVSENLVFMVQLDKPAGAESRGRNKIEGKTTRTPKAPMPLCGQVIAFNATVINQMTDLGMLRAIEIDRENFNDATADGEIFERRKAVMSEFLSFDAVRNAIVTKGTIASLITETAQKHNASSSFIYRCWSLLCRYGFSVDSLRPRRDRCGAPGAVRNCDNGNRKKAGRKTAQERISKMTGQIGESQPGMSSDWRYRIMVADNKIPSPKPKFSTRYLDILSYGFTTTYRHENGELKSVKLKKGEYPNKRQVRRVLEVEIPQLKKLLQKTTLGHFKRNLRAINGRNWEDVPGPGHTWAIDSTIGDIYLRSSINRAWIIGRPIVYTIVDVWSTAVVGFYVCLRGPSWAMAKVALFNAVMRTELFSDLWGFESMATLNPHPTLPCVVLGDNGEYKSFAAKELGFQYFERLSYTPPYRPDLKGLVEVLHRIAKDHQWWVEGAIDARREEFELRKFDPTTAAYTVRDYVEHLHNIYAEYNLTANRTNRLDTSMIADGVIPSPAGLWRWGHAVGIGTQRDFSKDRLIKDLLPESVLSINKDGLECHKLDYQNAAIAQAQWTAVARNHGTWKVPCHHYPGSVSRIWISNTINHSGLLELQLSDQANTAATNTYEEVQDAFHYALLNNGQAEHDRTVIQMDFHQANKQLHEKAKAETAEAVAANDQARPTLLAARALETQPSNSVAAKPASVSVDMDSDGDEDDEDSHLMTLKTLLHGLQT